MRYASDQKAKTRSKLLELASEMVRVAGIDATSVGSVMKSAQMTVGGFYKHFESQDALVDEALAHALSSSSRVLFHGIAQEDAAQFEQALVDRYLSEVHFDNPGLGCPVACNVSSLRQREALRDPKSMFARELKSFMRVVTKGAGSESRGWLVMCACVGALSVARALGQERGTQVLKIVRSELKQVLHATS